MRSGMACVIGESNVTLSAPREAARRVSLPTVEMLRGVYPEPVEGLSMTNFGNVLYTLQLRLASRG